MPTPEYLLDGLWTTFLQTMKAVEQTDEDRVALTLIGLLMDIVQGVSERRTDIARLISDLEVIGRAE